MLVWFGNLAPPFNLTPPFNLAPPFRILPPPFRILNGGGRINARAFENQHPFV